MNRKQLFNKLYKEGYTRFTEVGKSEELSDIINEVEQETQYIKESEYNYLEANKGEIIYFDGTHKAEDVKEMIDKIRWEGGIVVVHDTFPPDFMHTKQTLCGDVYRLAYSAFKSGVEGYTLKEDYGTTVFTNWKNFELIELEYGELSLEIVNTGKSDELEELKKEYEGLTGSRPKGRITVTSLKKKIDELRSDI